LQCSKEPDTAPDSCLHPGMGTTASLHYAEVRTCRPESFRFVRGRCHHALCPDGGSHMGDLERAQYCRLLATSSQLDFFRRFADQGGISLVDAIGDHSYSFPVPPAYNRFDGSAKPTWLGLRKAIIATDVRRLCLQIFGVILLGTQNDSVCWGDRKPSRWAIREAEALQRGMSGR
jgi:hypothetical protein